MPSRLRQYVDKLADTIRDLECVRCGDIPVIAHNESDLFAIIRQDAERAKGLFVVVMLQQGTAIPGNSGPTFEPQTFFVTVWSQPAVNLQSPPTERPQEQKPSIDPLDLFEEIIQELHRDPDPTLREGAPPREDRLYECTNWQLILPTPETQFFQYQAVFNAQLTLSGKK